MEAFFSLPGWLPCQDKILYCDIFKWYLQCLEAKRNIFHLSFPLRSKFFLFLITCLFWERISLHNSVWLWTHDPPASALSAGILGIYQHAQL
jgi:hypothetical protein